MNNDRLGDGGSLRAVNHNLLPVLRGLLRERSVTRAAQALGMTQPAASAALARLRLVLGDPLLVRSGRRMILSPRGEQLLPQVEDLAIRLALLWKQPDFDPSVSTRRFSLSSPDYVQVILAAALIDRVKREGPGLSVRFLDVPVDDVIDRRISGIDLMISIRQSLGAAAGAGFVIESLYKDRLVAVVGPQHRLFAASEVARQDFEHDDFLVFVGGARFLERRYDSLRNALSAPSTAIAVSQHYNSLLLIALQTDCVALVPASLAQRCAAMMPLRILDSEYSDFVIDVCLVWDRRFEADPEHRWLRKAIHDAVAVGTRT